MVKLEKYLKTIHDLYFHLYGWKHPSVNLHRFLHHTGEVIRALPLTPLFYSEQASEARNRHYRNYRQFFARKRSYEANLRDVFNRLMESSDPVITLLTSHLYSSKKKHEPLPAEAETLLLASESNEEGEETNTDDSDDEPENDWLIDLDATATSIEFTESDTESSESDGSVEL